MHLMDKESETQRVEQLTQPVGGSLGSVLAVWIQNASSFLLPIHSFIQVFSEQLLWAVPGAEDSAVNSWKNHPSAQGASFQWHCLSWAVSKEGLRLVNGHNFSSPLSVSVPVGSGKCAGREQIWVHPNAVSNLWVDSPLSASTSISVWEVVELGMVFAPWADRHGIPWGLLKDAELQVPPQIYGIRTHILTMFVCTL